MRQHRDRMHAGHGRARAGRLRDAERCGAGEGPGRWDRAGLSRRYRPGMEDRSDSLSLGGSDAIEEHRDQGYMLTSSGMNFVSAGAVMGAWVEPAGRGQTKVTVVTKRRMATNIATTLTETTHSALARPWPWSKRGSRCQLGRQTNPRPSTTLCEHKGRGIGRRSLKGIWWHQRCVMSSWACLRLASLPHTPFNRSGLVASALPAWTNRRVCGVCGVCGVCPCDGREGPCSNGQAHRGGGARALRREMSRGHGG